MRGGGDGGGGGMGEGGGGWCGGPIRTQIYIQCSSIH